MANPVWPLERRCTGPCGQLIPAREFELGFGVCGRCWSVEVAEDERWAERRAARIEEFDENARGER